MSKHHAVSSTKPASDNPEPQSLMSLPWRPAISATEAFRGYVRSQKREKSQLSSLFQFTTFRRQRLDHLWRCSGICRGTSALQLSHIVFSFPPFPPWVFWGQQVVPVLTWQSPDTCSRSREFSSARDDRLHSNGDNCMVLPDRPRRNKWRSHGILLFVLILCPTDAVSFTFFESVDPWR